MFYRRSVERLSGTLRQHTALLYHIHSVSNFSNKNQINSIQSIRVSIAQKIQDLQHVQCSCAAYISFDKYSKRIKGYVKKHFIELINWVSSQISLSVNNRYIMYRTLIHTFLLSSRGNIRLLRAKEFYSQMLQRLKDHDGFCLCLWRTRGSSRKINEENLIALHKPHGRNFD